MGDVADMMLDGTLCEGCGVYIEEGEPEGYPRYCSITCANDRGVPPDSSMYEEYDDEASIESIGAALDGAVVWIEMAIEDLKELKIKGRTRELSWLIKRLNMFKEKIGVSE